MSAALSLIGARRDATQITLNVRTNVQTAGVVLRFTLARRGGLCRGAPQHALRPAHLPRARRRAHLRVRQSRSPASPAHGSTADSRQPNVRCGDNGAVCPTSGNVCCLSVDTAAGTTTGECRPPETCPPTSLVLYCDDESDCPRLSPDGVVGICNLSFEHEADNYFTPRRSPISGPVTLGAS